MNNDQRAAGRHLAEIRGRKGWTQKQLAELSQVTERSISSFENGDTWPRAGTRAKLETALSLEPGYLSEYARRADGSKVDASPPKQFYSGTQSQVEEMIEGIIRNLDLNNPESVDAAESQARAFADLLTELRRYSSSGQAKADLAEGHTLAFEITFDDHGMAKFTTRRQEAGEGDGKATPLTQAGVSPADDGLGAFGHRDRGDLDHETVNDGGGENVHELFTPPPPANKTAAYRTRSRDKEEEERSRQRGEESQDPDDE